jgi:hypothetical protein
MFLRKHDGKKYMLGPNSMIFKKLLLIGLLGCGFFLLMAGLWGGLILMGWDWPSLWPGLPGVQAPLVVTGFFGTLLSLERTVGLKRRIGFMAPILILAGASFLIFYPLSKWSAALTLAGSGGLLIMCLVIAQQQRNIYTSMMVFGSISWFAGMVIWLLGWPMFNVYHWWMGFILFTLVGQRVELAHRLKSSFPPYWLLNLFLIVFFTGLAINIFGHLRGPDSVMDIILDAIVDPRLIWGMRISGCALGLCALWLLRYDSGYVLMRHGGIARYTAVCMLSGFVWLGLTGLFTSLFAGYVAGTRYDMIIQSFFMGAAWFVIFGHGVIVALSSFGLRLNHLASFYVPVVLLHMSMVVRIIGDLLLNYHIGKWGALLNVMAIILFFINAIFWLLADNRNLWWKQRDELSSPIE